MTYEQIFKFSKSVPRPPQISVSPGEIDEMVSLLCDLTEKFGEYTSPITARADLIAGKIWLLGLPVRVIAGEAVSDG